MSVFTIAVSDLSDFPLLISGNDNNCLFIVCALIFRSFIHHMDKAFA